MMIKHIVRRPKHSLPDSLTSLHPVLAQVVFARGVKDPLGLSLGFEGLLNYKGLWQVKEAAQLLAEGLLEQKKIVIVGDFDADGATSVAVATRVLRAFGGENIDFIVPNRFKMGYGLTPKIVELAAQMGAELIITVDNGIASHAGVNTARQAGMKVIITDHHLPGQTLPNAHAIVNPNARECSFLSKNLAGVGVIFYVMAALRAYLTEIKWFAKKKITTPNLAQFLDLVALGTIADVVPLDNNNRILVAKGMERIKNNLACAGIKALMQISGVQAQNVTASDLGFYLGPRLNAAGRLEDMSIGVACLLAEDDHKAQVLAAKLDALNKERRKIETAMKAEAIEMVKTIDIQNNTQSALVLHQENWHQGIVGILAGRIKEQFHLPTFCFAKVSDDELKGSGRSVSGLNLKKVLDSLAEKSPECMLKYGGHAMAAGVSIAPDKLNEFKTLLTALANQQGITNDAVPEIISDGELAANDLSLPLALLLEQSGPWGQGFEFPCFDNIFEITDSRVLGEKHLKFKLKLPDSPTHIEGIYFNTPNINAAQQYKKIKAVYELSVNRFRGKALPQLMIQYMEPIDE